MTSVAQRVVAIATGIALTATSFAVMEAAATAATNPTLEAVIADEAAAAFAKARETGRRVEVQEGKSETVLRWANPDGTFTDEVSARPVRTRRNGEWTPIDTTLVVDGGAVRPKAVVGDVTISNGGAGPLASVAKDGVAVSLGWHGKLPAPVVEGEKATYVEAMPGVDVEVVAHEAGFEQSFVVKNRQALRRAYQLPLATKGLSSLKDGAFVDSRGTERAWVGSARMWDATGRTAPVRVREVTNASGRALEMTPDAAMLADPSLKFPVTVDPSVMVYRYRDAYIVDTSPSTNFGSNAYLKVGKRGTSTYISYIEFPMASYASKQILDANLHLGVTDSVTCSARTTTVYPVTTSWAQSTVTWNSHPTTDISSGGLASATSAGGGPVGSSCEANAWMTFNSTALTSAFADWAANDSTNYGLSIRASSSDTTAAKDFASGENSSWTPRAEITYNNYPVLGSMSAGPLVQYTSGSTTTSYATSSTPYFYGRVTDAEQSATSLAVEVWNAAGTTLVVSGSSSRTAFYYSYAPYRYLRWNVPSGNLVDGTAYKWRARASDGSGYSPWSSWGTFTVDVTTPSAPTVTSSQYAQDVWDSAGGSGTFSFSTSATDVAHYLWGLDEAVPTTTSTASSVTINPMPDGWHTLSVRAVDKAGHLSPVTTYAFGATPSLTSPVDGAQTLGSVSLQSLTGNGASAVTYKYRRSTSDAWANIPVGDVTVASTSAGIGSWPVTWTPGSGDSIPPALNWDVAQTLGRVDGSILVQVCFGTTSPACSTATVWLTLDQNGFGGSLATTNVGVGEVSLVTGNLAVSSDDVAIGSYGSDLSLSRTANSRTPNAVGVESPQQMSLNQMGVETDTTGFAGSNATVARSTAQRAEGGASLLVTPSGTTSTDTYATVGGGIGGLRLGIQPGHSYLFTGKVYVPGATGLAHDRPGRGLRAVLFYKGSDGVYVETAAAAPTVTDQWVDQTIAFSVPTGATEAFIRLYNGFEASKSTKVVYYDALSLREQGPFGLGWVSGLTVDEADAPYTGVVDSGASVSVGIPDGSAILFTKSGSSYVATGESAESGLTLTAGSAGTNGPASFTLSDRDGNSTAFTPNPALTHTASASLPNTYGISTVTQPGSAQTTTYSYSQGRVTQVLAPVPSTGACTSSASSSTWQHGCRAIQLTYDSIGHLTAVTYATVHETAGTPLFVDIACYAYTGHRLTSYWDPRQGTPGTGSHPVTCGSPVRATTYSYDAAGRLASVTPPGLRPIEIGYDSNGRFSTASRTHGATHNNGATSTATVVYGISLSPDGTHPEYRPDMTAPAVAAWAQTDTPVTGAAVFGFGETASTADLRDAEVVYIDVNGRAVNRAGYSGTGASGWHIDTVEHDDLGRVVRSLSASNREEALDPTGPAGAALGLPNDTKAAAAMLDSRTFYSADGDVTDTYGPYHQVTLDDGTVTAARIHTRTTYDTGSEVGHPAGGSMHLPVQTVTTASLSGAADPAQTGADVDPRTTTMEYALDASNAEGWTFRTPLRTTVDPTGLNLKSVNRYDPTTGLQTETWLPKASSSTTPTGDVDKYKRVTTYYTAPSGTAPDDVANCLKRAWVNLVCKIGPKAQPGVTGLPGLPVTQYAYDYLLRPVTLTETVTPAGGGSQSRVTTTTYGQSGYGTTVSSVSTTGGTGPAVPTVSFAYDTATGLATQTSAAATTELAASTISVTYDDFGRTRTYTDADGATTTTTYDDTTGRVASIADGKATVTYGYGSSTERRGLPTSLTVAGITGSFAATYDAEGRLASETWPNGLVRTTSTDETGAVVGIEAVLNGNVWWTEQVSRSASGAMRDRVSSTSSQTYEYDLVGRLTGVEDVVAAQCAVRTYTFDANSNRTGSTAYPAAEDGACQTSTGSVVAQHSHDPADRLKAEFHAGLTYDAWGRVTTLPAEDAGGTAMTSTYFVNDRVRSQTQGTRTLTWALDPMMRARSWSDSATSTTRTNHYADDSDGPSWIHEGGTSWTKFVTGLSGGLTASLDQAGTVTYHLANLDGDIVATASASATTAPDAYQDADEFGNVRGSGTPRYGWVGEDQRSGDALGRTVLMGVRVYSPVLGRFLQSDPVDGGSSNRYDYADQDPINRNDVTGRASADAVSGGNSSCTCKKAWSTNYTFWSYDIWTHEYISSQFIRNWLTDLQSIAAPFAIKDFWRQKRYKYAQQSRTCSGKKQTRHAYMKTQRRIIVLLQVQVPRGVTFFFKKIPKKYGPIAWLVPKKEFYVYGRWNDL